MKSNTQEFIEKARKVHGELYDYSNVTYKHSKAKVLIKCNKCGYLFEQTPNSHLRGSGCPNCSKEKTRVAKSLDTQKFIQKARELHKNKYDYSKVNYVNSQTKVCIICSQHGEFWQKPVVHLQGCGCPECSKKYQGPDRKSTEEFIQEAKEIHGDRYDYSVTNYLGSRKKVAIICPKHGVFYQMPNSHLRGSRCSKCRESKGELFVEDILKQLKISYQTQYKIGFKGIYMKVDFLVEFNNKKFIIEYNGQQHYIPVKYFGGELKFEQQVKRDNILRQYCLQNDITLIEIKYDMKKDQILNLLKNNLK